MCFKIHNIYFEINYIFLSLLIIYIACDRTGIYLPLLLSVIIHEFSHILCLIIFKCKFYSVKLNIGAITIKYNENISNPKKIISILMGPLSNLLISYIGFTLKNELLIYINLILAFYNFLPINGLDGGELIKTSFSGILSDKTIEKILNVATIVVSIAVFAVCFIFKVYSVYVLLFCVYLISPLILKNLLKH